MSFAKKYFSKTMTNHWFKISNNFLLNYRLPNDSLLWRRLIKGSIHPLPPSSCLIRGPEGRTHTTYHHLTSFHFIFIIFFSCHESIDEHTRMAYIFYNGSLYIIHGIVCAFAAVEPSTPLLPTSRGVNFNLYLREQTRIGNRLFKRVCFLRWITHVANCVYVLRNIIYVVAYEIFVGRTRCL